MKNNDSSKKKAEDKFIKMQAEREKALKQKEDQIKGIIDTIQNKPKFIRLVEFALNSLDNLITPPNKDIKLNSSIIIKENGVESLKAITTYNLPNEELLKKVGIILNKLLGNPIDKELSQDFVEKNGQELIIETVLSKSPGVSSEEYVKSLNSLVGVNQLIPNLINSGVVEATKIINDLYDDYPDIVSLNLDTMKKISNNKLGREALTKKNMLSSILKSIIKSSENKDKESVVTGLKLADNITRTKEAVEDLKDNKVINQLNNVLDIMEDNEEVLQLGAKILSKITSKEDLQNQIDTVLELDTKNISNSEEDDKKVKEYEKNLAKTSNMMLVDEENTYLKKNLDKMKVSFMNIKQINLNDKTKDFINSIISSSKNFMKIFTRMLNSLDQVEMNKLIDSDFINNILETLKQNWNNFKNKLTEEELALNNESGKVTKDYIVSSCNMLEKAMVNSYSNNGKFIANDLSSLNSMLDILKESSNYFLEDEKYNSAVSKILNLASEAKEDAIQNIINDNNSLQNNSYKEAISLAINKIANCYPNITNLSCMFDYIKKAINCTLDGNTIKDLINCVIKSLTDNLDYNIVDLFIPVILTTLKDKYQDRECVEASFNFLNLVVRNEEYMNYLNKEKEIEKSNLYNIDLVLPITEGLTKNEFFSLTELKSINFLKNNNTNSKINYNENIKDNDNEYNLGHEKKEEAIKKNGGQLLSSLVSLNDLKKHVSNLKDSSNSFKPDNYNSDQLLNLDTGLRCMLAFSHSDTLFNSFYTEVLGECKSLIEKEVNFIEMFKKNSDLTKIENKDIVIASNKRLDLICGLVTQIDQKCQNYIEKNCSSSQAELYMLGVKQSVDIMNEMINKCSDSDTLVKLIDYISNDVDFVFNNETNLAEVAESSKEKQNRRSIFNNTIKRESIKFEATQIEKIINSFVGLLRKYPDNDDIVIKTLDGLNHIISMSPLLINDVVKTGIPKILLQLLESGNRESVAIKSLELIKKIAESSNSNLDILSNQDIISKLYDVGSNYGSKITEYTAPLLELVCQLPSNETKIQDIVNNTSKDVINEILNVDWNFFSKKSKQILDYLRKLNVFATSSNCNNKQIESLVKNEEFMECLDKLIEATKEDNDMSKYKEPLLNNELNLLQKMYNYYNDKTKNIRRNKPNYEKDKELKAEYDNHTEAKENIIKKIIPLCASKNYSAISTKAAFTLNDFIEDQLKYEENVNPDIQKSLCSEEMVDGLFETLDNFLGDNELSSQINKLLSNICIVSNDLSKYIISKGGLNSILNDLRYLTKSDSSESKKQLLNNLKFIERIIADKDNFDKFIDLKGPDIIENIIKQEAKKIEDVFNPNVKLHKSSSVNKRSINQDNNERSYTVTTNNKLSNSIQQLNTNPDNCKHMLLDVVKDKRKRKKIDQSNSSNSSVEPYLPVALNICKKLNEEKISPNKKYVKWVSLIGKSSFPDLNFFKSTIRFLSSLLFNNQDLLRNDIDNNSLKDTVQLITSSLHQFSELSQSSILKNNETDQITTTISSCLTNPLASQYSTALALKKSNYMKILDSETLNSVSEILAVIPNGNNISEIKSILDSINTTFYNDRSSNHNELSEERPKNNINFFDYNDVNHIERFINYLNQLFDNNIFEINNNLSNIAEPLKKFLKNIYNDIDNISSSPLALKSFINLLSNLSKLEDIKPQDVLDEDYCLNKLFDTVSPYVCSQNLTYSKDISNGFNELYKKACEGSGINDSYINYMQNQFFKSLDVFDNLYDIVSQPLIIKQLSKINKEDINDQIKLCKDNLIKYYNATDVDIDNKNSSMNRVYDICNNYISNDNIDDSIKTHFWEVLNKVLDSDKNGNLLNNENAIAKNLSFIKNELVMNHNACQDVNDSLSDSTNIEESKSNVDFSDINKNKNDILLDNLNTISNKITTQYPLGLNIIDIIEEDINNYKKEIPSNVLSKHIDSLSNISKLPVVQKAISNKELLVKQLANFYNDKVCHNLKDRINLAHIFKNLTENENNNLKLIDNNPEVFETLFDYLKQPINYDDVNCEEANQIEEECFSNLLSSNITYTKLLSKNIVNEDLINEIISKREDSTKLAKIKTKLDEIKERESEEEKLNKEKEMINNLTDKVDDLFTANFNKIIEFKNAGFIDTQSKSNLRLSISKNSIKKLSITNIPAMNNLISSDNENLSKNLFKTDLSSKHNPEVIEITQNVIDNINKCLNDINKITNDKDTNPELLQNKKAEVHRLFRSLKQIAYNPDNHQAIIELGLNEIIDKLNNEKSIDLKNEYTKDLNSCLKSCLNNNYSVSSFVKSKAGNAFLDDAINIIQNSDKIINESNEDNKQFNEDLINNTSNIFALICKDKEGFKTILDKLGFEKLLELSKTTESPEVLESIQNALLNSWNDSNKLVKFGDYSKDICLLNQKCINYDNEKHPDLVVNSVKLSSKIIENNNNNNNIKTKDTTLNSQNSSETSDNVNSNINKRKSIVIDPIALQTQSLLLSKVDDTFDNIFSKDINNFNSLLNYLGNISDISISTLSETESSNLLAKVINTFNSNNLNKRLSELDINDPNLIATNDINLKQSLANLPTMKEDVYENDDICDNYSKVISNLLSFNKGAANNLCNLNVVNQLYKIVKKHRFDSEKPDILSKAIKSLEIFTSSSKKACVELAKIDDVIDTFNDALESNLKNPLVLKSTINCLNNCVLNKEALKNIKDNLKINDLSKNLINIQKAYYFDSDMLLKINNICDCLLNNFVKDDNDRENLIKIVTVGMSTQEYNEDLMSSSLKTINNNINLDKIKHFIAENSLDLILDVANNFKNNPKIATDALKILTKISNNNIHANSMINKKVLNKLDDLMNHLNNSDEISIEDKLEIKKHALDLIDNFLKNNKSAEQTAEILMKHIIAPLENINNSNANINSCIKTISNLAKNKNILEPFIHNKGFERLKDFINNTTNRDKNSQLTSINSNPLDSLYEALKILSYSLSNNPAYKDDLIALGYIDILNKLLSKEALEDNRIDYEARSKLYISNN